MKLPTGHPAPAAKELPEGYEILHRGPHYDVVIKSKTKQKLEKKATADQLAALQDLVERYGETGPNEFPRGKFNASEEWFPSEKDKRLLLQAFKPGQLRVYGYAQHFNGRHTFFATGYDRAKKQDRADQDVLKAAGKEAVRVFDQLKK